MVEIEDRYLVIFPNQDILSSNIPMGNRYHDYGYDEFHPIPKKKGISGFSVLKKSSIVIPSTASYAIANPSKQSRLKNSNKHRYYRSLQRFQCFVGTELGNHLCTVCGKKF